MYNEIQETAVLTNKKGVGALAGTFDFPLRLILMIFLHLFLSIHFIICFLPDIACTIVQLAREGGV